MSISNIEEEKNSLPFDSVFFNDQIDRIIDETLPKFEKFSRKFIAFHVGYACLGLLEITLVTAFLTEIVQFALLAASLGLLFFTFFSYFIIRLYLRARKPERIEEIKNQFMLSCKTLISFREEIPEHHLALANSCTRFSNALQGKESEMYWLPKFLDFLDSTVTRMSFFFHWEDVHTMREALLLASIQEHIQLVKFEPTDLAVHVALANAYVLLSALYLNPNNREESSDETLFPAEKRREQLMRKFVVTAERAIEEFKILNDYAPNDPWVHLQLAYSYHDLGMPEEEIREYVTVLRLCPEDKDTLFKLGVLYFQQGKNAKGLQIYEELKRCHYKKAEQLITYYGIYTQITAKFGFSQNILKRL